MKKLTAILMGSIFALTLILTGIPKQTANAAAVTIQNGTQWRDTTNGSLQAHGGHIIKVGSTYYWYGEDKSHNSATFKNVCVYSSTDLKSWTWRSYALTPSSDPELASCKIERPKVLYNSSTGRYVMWAHYENAGDYNLARVAVASSSSPTGPFTYHGSFRPNNNESRDFTVFQDTDGQAYLFSSSNTNSNLRLYRLTSDYLGVAAELNMIYEGKHREAPAVVKKGNIYYLITSGASGWYPNQGMYSTATNINGPWSTPQPIGNSSTFYSQPAFILTVQGSGTTSYLYCGDRWNPNQLGDSRYVWLPLTLNGTSASIEYYDSISVDAATGAVSGAPNGTLISQGKVATAQSSAGGNPASYANDGNYQSEWVATGSTWPHWWKVDLGAVYNVKNVQISWWMMNGSEAFYKYKIETSTDNTNWTVALDRTGNTTYGFTSDTLSANARYVRINMVDADLWNNPGNWYTPRLWEVKIYGDATSGNPTPVPTLIPAPTPTPVPGAAVRWQSHNYPTRYIANDNGTARIVENPTLANSEWTMVPGLADSSGVSFQLKSNPSIYLRHYDYVLRAETNSGGNFAADATFYAVAGLADSSKVSFQSYNYPSRYIRHYSYNLRIEPISTATEKNDATFARQ